MFLTVSSHYFPPDGVDSVMPEPGTPQFMRGSRSLPGGLFHKKKSSHRASDIYFILLAWAIVLVQVWLNLWILKLLPIPVAGKCCADIVLFWPDQTVLYWDSACDFSSVGAEEAGGSLWPQKLCRADSLLVVGCAGGVRSRAGAGAAAWTNQRSRSVPASYRHQGKP